MFHQEIGDQLLVLVPPFGLLGFRAEAGCVHGDFGFFGFQSWSLTFLWAVCAVTTRILVRRRM
jgi:hypothetical protein